MRYGHFRDYKNPFLPLGTEPDFVDCTVHSLVTVHNHASKYEWIYCLLFIVFLAKHRLRLQK